MAVRTMSSRATIGPRRGCSFTSAAFSVAYGRASGKRQEPAEPNSGRVQHVSRSRQDRQWRRLTFDGLAEHHALLHRRRAEEGETHKGARLDRLNVGLAKQHLVVEAWIVAQFADLLRIVDALVETG